MVILVIDRWKVVRIDRSADLVTSPTVVSVYQASPSIDLGYLLVWSLAAIDR